nr:AAC(3) family N-acetyltransferase [Clostridia bacterium]
MLTKSDVKFSLELMGIEKGDILLVHSALTAIGEVDGGADTVIDAFLESVGEEGTVVMSTLTGWGAPFDRDTSPSAVGWLGECFRRRPGTLRSMHPVHSVAAYGRHAEYIVSGHENCPTGCGEGTPYDKLEQLGAKAILLGVDMDRNTIMHTLEERADLEYLLSLDIPAPTYTPDKKVFTLTKFPPGHRDFLSATPYLRRSGAMVEGMIGDAVTKVIDIKKLAEVMGSELKKNPLFFICHNENCNFCNWARKLYAGSPINFADYTINVCSDKNCEVCVVDESYRPNI